MECVCAGLGRYIVYTIYTALFHSYVTVVTFVVFTDLPRTNNSVEGWHNALRSFIGHSHPNIFKFIDNIKSEQSLQEMKISQISASQEAPPSKKKYTLLDERIKKIALKYERNKVEEYMRSIAHNIQF